MVGCKSNKKTGYKCQDRASGALISPTKVATLKPISLASCSVFDLSTVGNSDDDAAAADDGKNLNENGILVVD